MLTTDRLDSIPSKFHKIVATRQVLLRYGCYLTADQKLTYLHNSTSNVWSLLRIMRSTLPYRFQ